VLEFPGPTTRVLSLVPSVTETLHRMGAATVLVGRTDYDTLPSLGDLPSVGGGLGPNLEVVRTLEPQVVVTFAGESDSRTTQGIEGFGIPVFAVRPDRIEDVPRIIRQLGQLVGRAQDAEALVAEIQGDLDGVRRASAGLEPLDAVYLLGGSPPLAAGPGTFISDLMALAGARNALDDLAGLYAPVSPEVLVARHVDVLLVGEGETVDPRLVRGRRVMAIPSWVEIPGPRLGEAAWVVARALRPELEGTR
jgi:ABC-type Fe3+-hydroxamate transport system substrate-binding protein